jgi:signal transduction histidine kinase
MVEVAPAPDGGVTVAVADDGPGIADDDKPRVTERFYRGEAGHDKPGVGLGLSLVQAVAALHSGRLDLADNHPGLVARMSVA